MTTLDRYILRQLLGPLGFFAFVLTGVVWLTQSLRIIDIVVNNGQGARVFLEFTAFLLPAVLAIVLQLGALAATVFTLQRLMADSEVTAALASGASRLRVVRPVAVFGGGLVVLLAFDTLYLMPTAARELRDRLTEVRTDLAAGLIRDGRFINPAPGLTVYIREITAQGEMLGVLVQDAKDREQPVIYTAKSAFLTEGDTPTLVMFSGQAQRLENDGRQLSLLRFDRLTYDLTSFTAEGGARTRKPSERYFWELVNPPPELAPNRRALGRLVSEGHEQLSAPLYGLALPMIAAAAMLGAGFSRYGAAGAVVAALGVGAGVRVLGLAAKNLTSDAPELWPLMYAIPILAVIGSVLWLSRPTLRRAGARLGSAQADAGGARA